MNDLPNGHRDRPSVAGPLVRVGRLTLAAVPVWLTFSFVTGDAPAELRGIVGIIAIVSLFRPSEGLCIVALAVPLGDLVAVAMESSPLRLTDALVVAFLSGWLISPTHGPARGPAPRAAARYAALAVSALILASIAANVLQIKAQMPADWPGMFSRTLHEYFKAGSDDFGAVAGGRLIEGLGLSAAVVLLLRRQPILAVWIPEALGAGCVIVVVAAYSLWHGYAFSAVLARHAVIGDRIVAHVSDINAAASYFALMACLASGMAARERGPRRIWWVVVAGSAMEGLWFSGSRSANLAVGLAFVAAAIWVPSRRWRKAVRYGVFAAVMTALVAAAAFRAAQIEGDPTRQGAGDRKSVV